MGIKNKTFSFGKSKSKNFNKIFIVLFVTGRRRNVPSPSHPHPHLHPHLPHHQHHSHVDHERHLEPESDALASAVPLLRLSSRAAASPSCGVAPRHPSGTAHRMRSCHSYVLATLLLVASTFLGVTGEFKVIQSDLHVLCDTFRDSHFVNPLLVIILIVLPRKIVFYMI